MGQTGSFPGASMGNGSDDSKLWGDVAKGSMVTSAMGSILTGFGQSRAIKAQGDYEAGIADTNAKIAGLESTQAEESGDAALARRNLEARGTIGTERAAAGASGTDVNSGSNAITQIGTDFASKIDQLTIKNNAARQAWGYQTTAIQDNYQGQFAKLTAATQSQQTLLNGGMGAISGPLAIGSNYLRWSRYMGGGSGTGQPYDMGTN